MRTNGYKTALEENFFKVDEDLILKIEEIDESEAEIERFLKNKEVDGVFAVNEHFAISAIKAIQESGRKVPDDVSVIGFTDGELSKRFIPSLTTVSQHGTRIGEEAARVLIEKLENTPAEDDRYKTIIVETGLVIRNSTKSRK